jgi:hypothetical protein
MDELCQGADSSRCQGSPEAKHLLLALGLAPAYRDGGRLGIENIEMNAQQLGGYIRKEGFRKRHSHNCIKFDDKVWDGAEF